jgi:predicted PurR-regulated permease PerM
MLLTQVVIFAISIGAMYWAQALLLPIAIAIFFAFILSPLVTQLQRTRLGRTPCVFIIVLTVGLLLFSLGWFLSAQVAALAADLPEHRAKISLKIRTVQEMLQRGVPQRLRNLVEEIKDDLKDGSTAPTKPPASAEKEKEGTNPSSQETSRQPLMAVTVMDWQTHFTQYLSTILTSLVGSLLALVLVIFILIHREDLRDKIMRLVGKSYITAATKAVDETFQRLSRFLLMQATINASFGIVISAIFFCLVFGTRCSGVFWLR